MQDSLRRKQAGKEKLKQFITLKIDGSGSSFSEMIVECLILCVVTASSLSWPPWFDDIKDDISLDVDRFRRDAGGDPETSTEDMGTAPPIETGEAVGPTLGDILRKD